VNDDFGIFYFQKLWIFLSEKKKKIESKGFGGKRIYVNEKCQLFKYKGKK